MRVTWQTEVDKTSKQMASKKIVEDAIVPAETTTTDLIVAEDYSAFAGDADKLTKDDMMLERFRICQALSKVKDLGVAEGDIYGTLSKQGKKSVLVLPIHEERVIVERLAKQGNSDSPDDGKYLGTLSLDDPRVKEALARNGNSYIKLQGTRDGQRTNMVETRNVHVVFLAEDGVTPEGFGVLVFESVNITPLLLWKQDRTRIKGGAGLPSYAFRSVVTTETHTNPTGKKSKKFKISPFNGSWAAAVLRPSQAGHLELLTKCAEHKKLIASGAALVDYSDADDSEAAQESAAF
jgi:hypothetical protein